MVMRIARPKRRPLSGRQASSPKREATSSAIASIASCAWRPEVVTRMQQPGLAASIIRPMIELPPTDTPSLSTVTAAA